MLRLFRAKDRVGTPPVFLLAPDARLARALARRVFRSPHVFVHIALDPRAQDTSADFTPLDWHLHNEHRRIVHKQQASVARLGAYLDEKKAKAIELLKAGTGIDAVAKLTSYSRAHVLRINAEIIRGAPDPEKWCGWCGKQGFEFCGARCKRMHEKDSAAASL